jgi:hypothetical protein
MDITIEATMEDDQYSNAELTPGAVSKGIDGGAHLFSGIIGSPNNARRAWHAERQLHPAAGQPHRLAGVG